MKIKKYTRRFKVLLRKRPLALLLVGLSLFLGIAVDSHADVVMRRRVVRHFPDNLSCPFRSQYDLWFIATAPTATVFFKTLPSTSSSEGTTLKISDLHVAEESKFAGSFRAEPSESQCWDSIGGAPYFHSDGPGSSDIVLPLDSATGWALVNAQVENQVLRLGTEPLQQSQASFKVSGLTPGKKYFVTGWSNWDLGGSEFNVEVDTPRPAAVFLQLGRFKLEIRYDPAQALAGGEARTERSAVFWFRDPLKLELIVNVVDRCSDARTYWVTVGGTTGAEARIKITDQITGKSVTYQNRSGQRFKTVVDQTTFRCQ
jgi:hypothetical protein